MKEQSFKKGDPLILVHKFIRSAIPIEQKDIEVNDAILGKWDTIPVLTGNFKITVERIIDLTEQTPLSKEVLFDLGFTLNEMDLSGWYTRTGYDILLVNITKGYRDTVSGKDVETVGDLMILMNDFLS